MRPSHLCTAIVIAICAPHAAYASDACSPLAIVTSAQVRVSDGKRYVMETYYSAPEIAALRQISSPEDTTIIATEGPRAWAINQEGGDDNLLRTFAMGHQFHALLLHFDDIVIDAHDTEVTYRGATRRARVGHWPFGAGEAQLVYQAAGNRVDALILSGPERPDVVVRFSNWRSVRGERLPFRAAIDDGTRIFHYAFTRVDTAPRVANWFFDALPTPTSDDVQIYRAHRRMLAAHCAGDAAALAAAGSAPIELDVSADGVRTTTNSALQSRFERVFGSRDYQEYHDDAWPIIEVSDDGAMGWAAVTTRAVGVDRQSGERFEDRWIWVELMRKIDGAWRRAGIVSMTRRE